MDKCKIAFSRPHGLEVRFMIMMLLLYYDVFFLLLTLFDSSLLRLFVSLVEYLRDIKHKQEFFLFSLTIAHICKRMYD